MRLTNGSKSLEKGDIVVLAGGAKILPRQKENKVIGGCVKI